MNELLSVEAARHRVGLAAQVSAMLAEDVPLDTLDDTTQAAARALLALLLEEARGLLTAGMRSVRLP